MEVERVRFRLLRIVLAGARVDLASELLSPELAGLPTDRGGVTSDFAASAWESAELTSRLTASIWKWFGSVRELEAFARKSAESTSKSAKATRDFAASTSESVGVTLERDAGLPG